VRNINLSGNVLHHLDGRFQVVLSLQRLHFCRNQLRVIEPSVVEAVTLQVVSRAPLLSQPYLSRTPAYAKLFICVEM
jgi:hypothetical protein